MIMPVFGTATLPTGTSETSPRGEEGFYRHFGTATPSTGASVASPRGEGGLLTGLWHGDPAYRYLRDIPAWRRGLLTGLWHSDPAHRYLSGIPAWRTASRPVHDRQLTDALAGLRHGDPAHRHLRTIFAWRRGLLTGLRDGTPATGTSEPSPQGHCYLVNRIVAEMGFVKFTWHEPLLIIK